MKLTILGAPGAGKGTQAQVLASYYKIAHISTGDLLRQFIRGEIGQGPDVDTASLDAQMKRGDLAPDSIIFELLINRLNDPDCADGYVLDGFPRNLAQAEMFEKNGFRFDAVIAIEVDDEIIIDRIANRWSCPGCGRPYHLHSNPPKIEGICDDCRSALVKRSDDSELTVANRLKIYHNVTKPIIEFYKERGFLREVSGIGSVDEITDAIVDAITLINEA